MLPIIEGTYSNGLITLLEIPRGLREGRIRVQVLGAEEAPSAPSYLVFGKYKGDKDPTLNDFKAVEWNGEEEFDALYGK